MTARRFLFNCFLCHLGSHLLIAVSVGILTGSWLAGLAGPLIWVLLLFPDEGLHLDTRMIGLTPAALTLVLVTLGVRRPTDDSLGFCAYVPIVLTGLVSTVVLFGFS